MLFSAKTTRIYHHDTTQREIKIRISGVPYTENFIQINKNKTKSEGKKKHVGMAT